MPLEALHHPRTGGLRQRAGSAKEAIANEEAEKERKLKSGYGSTFLTTGDLNGDGKPDLARLCPFVAIEPPQFRKTAAKHGLGLFPCCIADATRQIPSRPFEVIYIALQR